MAALPPSQSRRRVRIVPTRPLSSSVFLATAATSRAMAATLRWRAVVPVNGATVLMLVVVLVSVAAAAPIPLTAGGIAAGTTTSGIAEGAAR